MSVVACTGVGSRGIESSPGRGDSDGSASTRSSVLERNIAILARRGIVFDADIMVVDSPTRPTETDQPSDEVVARWVASQPAFQEGFVPSIIVAGLGSTSMLRGLWRETAATRDGYTPRIWVVEPDVRRALAGLGEFDLADVLSDERVECLVAADAFERLQRSLLDRLDTTLQCICVSDDGAPSSRIDHAKRILDHVVHEQERRRVRLRARVAAIYAERNVEWWAKRYGEAARGGEPLRILLPSCRFTTYVQHAARDLARAFERRGIRAEVLLERDSHSRLSTVAYLDRLADLRPDLVVLINYPRSTLALDMPKNVPVLCWMQDAMPHLFDEKVGASQGEFDFVMGHVFRELYTTFGYPMGRTLPAVVVADDAKFHRSEVPAELHERHACEIALVSHHSETPEAMHERLKCEVGRDAATLRVLDELYPYVRATVRACMDVTPLQRLRYHAGNVWRERLGEEPPPRALSLLTNNYAIPLADRMLRHEMVGWAVDIAKRRGWRLALYGRGWENNATHAEFARGELRHGEELRAVYSSAAVNLHCSLSALVHQRVIECVLSGGVCLLRLTRDCISAARSTLTRDLLALPPDVEEAERIGYVVADHAPAMAFAALEQRLGLSLADDVVWIPVAKADAARRLAPLHICDQDANWAFGDLSEIGFASREKLEQLVENAVERPGWRRGVSELSACRASQCLTHAALAGRALEFVRSGFEQSSKRRRVPA